MSNKSRMPAGAKQGVRGTTRPSFVDMLDKAAKNLEKVRDAKDVDVNGNGDEDDSDDGHSGLHGNLPIPVSQQVIEGGEEEGLKKFIWIWEPLPDKAHVMATYYVQSKVWAINLIVEHQMTEYDPEEAKRIAEALLAAQNWPNVWKEYVADFILDPGKPLAPIKIHPLADVPEDEINEDIENNADKYGLLGSVEREA